jgi:hypothetical protein
VYKVTYIFLTALLISCSVLKPRIKNISSEKVIDQLEKLQLYGLWKSDEGTINFKCSGSFSLDYNYNNIRYKDNRGHISRIDTKQNTIYIKEPLFESAYRYKIVARKIKINKIKNSQENMMHAQLSFTMLQMISYDCKKLREMGPIGLSKYYLTQ